MSRGRSRWTRQDNSWGPGARQGTRSPFRYGQRRGKPLALSRILRLPPGLCDEEREKRLSHQDREALNRIDPNEHMGVLAGAAQSIEKAGISEVSGQESSAEAGLGRRWPPQKLQAEANDLLAAHPGAQHLDHGTLKRSALGILLSPQEGQEFGGRPTGIHLSHGVRSLETQEHSGIGATAELHQNGEMLPRPQLAQEIHPQLQCAPGKRTAVRGQKIRNPPSQRRRKDSSHALLTSEGAELIATALDLGPEISDLLALVLLRLEQPPAAKLVALPTLLHLRRQTGSLGLRLRTSEEGHDTQKERPEGQPGGAELDGAIHRDYAHAVNLPDIHMIDKSEGLVDLARCLEGCSRFGVDTESNSFYVYREQVCYLQVSCRGEIFIVDTLAVTNLDVLKPFFEDPSITKVLHGADYDVSCLGRDFDIRFQDLFDTHVAAQFLGFEKLGLASLVEKFKGIVLDKSYTRYDWGRRPLNNALLRYLSDDVVHLDDLHDELESRLEEADLVEEATIEFRRVARQEWPHQGLDPEGFRRIKGASHLDQLGLSILRQLYLWREARAEAANVPPFRIINNRHLLDISGTRPRTLHDLSRRAAVSHKLIPRYGKDLISAVSKGLETWREVPLKLKTKSRRSLNGNVVAEALKQWRKTEAAARSCPPLVVLPNHVIDTILKTWPRSQEELAAIEDLGSRRLENYGPKILQILSRHPNQAPAERDSSQ